MNELKYPKASPIPRDGGTVAAPNAEMETESHKATPHGAENNDRKQARMSQEVNPIHLDRTNFTPVTSEGRAVGAASAERKRRQRKRELIYERDDWQLFLDLATLPQKAGCYPFQLNQIVLKELVDNALDAGANVSLEYIGDQWIVHDDGPGINPADVPKLFSINRPLLSSKLVRLPSRGMLGNGLRVVMGAVSVRGGILIVETRGHRLHLATDSASGETLVVADELISKSPGTTVRLSLPGSKHSDQIPAQTSIQIAECGNIIMAPRHPGGTAQVICIAFSQMSLLAIQPLPTCAAISGSNSMISGLPEIRLSRTLRPSWRSCAHVLNRYRLKHLVSSGTSFSRSGLAMR